MNLNLGVISAAITAAAPQGEADEGEFEEGKRDDEERAGRGLARFGRLDRFGGGGFSPASAGIKG